jgi:hypothetical protein
MSADKIVGPAIFVNHLGKGKVLTFVSSPEYATASEHHIVEARFTHLLLLKDMGPIPNQSI